MKFILSIFTVLILFILISPIAIATSPQSSSFILEDYGFGSGGVATSSSTNFLFSGLTGEIETGSPSSTSFIALPGLTYILQPNIPAPTVTNPSNYYNKLHVVIANAGYPSDTTFAIQVSSGSANFSQNVYYVQGSNALGSSFAWQPYSGVGGWGGASGFDMIGLYPGATYYVRVAAKRGTYQQGPWSATTNASTINPTFTFNLQTSSQPTPPLSVNIGQLSAGAVTTSSDKIITTISTNADNGGLIYVYGANTGLKSTTDSYTIGSASVDLSSGGITEGYGARGTTVTQTSGGPMRFISPYNGSGNNVGILDTTERLFADSTNSPVTSGQASFEIQAKASSSTPAGSDYADILTIIATGSF